MSTRVAVIGRGLIGSAAARYLAQDGHDVTLIGPDEPSDMSSHRGVFGSHYDEGRITRLLDPHPVWEELAAASIEQYAMLEAQSGVSFFQEVGLLIGAPAGSAYLDKVKAVQASASIDCSVLSGKKLQDAFPYLSFEPDMEMLYQRQKAGHISPRQLVDAQTQLAVRSGATLVREYAREVEDGAVDYGAGMVHFDRVLVACGAFTNMVLEQPLDLRPLARTIALFELDEDEAARLATMPSLIYRVADGADPYVLPPIRYPDGRIYLKIGGEPKPVELADAQDAKDWFRSGGNAQLGAYMENRINELLPGLSYRSVHTQACAVTYTKTGLPYIGPLSNSVVVAAGGCGGAAKSSDALGRIAANALMGDVDPRFEVVMKNCEVTI